jgi:transcription elongation GreA/GreB family factor
MDKADLVAQLIRHLRASAVDAEAQMAAASTEAREGATPAEKREDARVALEQGSIARGQQQRLQRARADLALLDGFAPRPLPPSAEVEMGAVVEVDSETMGRTFFLAPAGAGIELTGPGGDGYLSVVTPSSPVGRAVLGCVVGDVVEVAIGNERRAWTVSWVG